MDDIDDELAACLAPVLRDLAAGNVPAPRLQKSSWHVHPDTLEIMVFAPNGSGQGVSIQRGEPFVDQLARLADQVQEWAVEALWAIGRSAVWPECPEHPNSHPLRVDVSADQTGVERAVWRCPKSNVVAFAVGEMPTMPESVPTVRKRGR